MGRPPKGSKLPYQAVENVQEHMNAAQIAHQGLPSKKWTGIIVRCLLQRQRLRFPREYAHCRETIAAIANLEFSLVTPSERIEKEIERELHKLVYQKPSRETHHCGSVLSQHGAGCNYFEQERYPTKPRNSQTRKDWIAKHWDRLVALLSPIKCHHEYTVDLSAFLNEAKKHNLDWTSPAETVKVIVASLHNTSLANLERLLKPRS